MVLEQPSKNLVPENGTMSLILRLRSPAVNWPTRGIFEQSALKIRATARKWIVLRSLSDAGRLGSKLQRHKKEAAKLFEVAPAQMRAFYALMVAAKEGGVSSRDKERIALAIAMRCDGCVLDRVEAARRHGAQREEAIQSPCLAHLG
jgi:AhpD family alkylhydroperoxidase